MIQLWNKEQIFEEKKIDEYVVVDWWESINLVTL